MISTVHVYMCAIVMYAHYSKRYSLKRSLFYIKYERGITLILERYYSTYLGRIWRAGDDITRGLEAVKAQNYV